MKSACFMQVENGARVRNEPFHLSAFSFKAQATSFNSLLKNS
jgi:hypothetical protein